MSSALSAKISRRLLFTSSGLVAYPLFFGKILSNGQLVIRGELSNTINLTAHLVLGLNPNKNKRQDAFTFWSPDVFPRYAKHAILSRKW